MFVVILMAHLVNRIKGKSMAQLIAMALQSYAKTPQCYELFIKITDL